jgi:large-conductance mechanosensitive channel
MCIGIIIATQISNLTTSFNNNIIQPIIEKSSILWNNKLENYKYNILGVEFKLGKIIIDLIKCLIILVCIYFIWKISISTNLDYITKYLNNLKLNK